jgi:hypothetical protein
MSLAKVSDTDGLLLTVAGMAGAGAVGAMATALTTARTFLRLGIITTAAVCLGSSDDDRTTSKGDWEQDPLSAKAMSLVTVYVG